MHKWLIFVLGLFLLSACQPSQPEPINPTQKFFEQDVSWQSCEPLLSSPAINFYGPILDRLECSRVQTPLDWRNPELDSVNLAVLRVKAGSAAERKGSILTNPGGPGGDGLTLGAFLGLVFATADDDTPAGSELQALSAQFDVIGFSPRGVGDSFQLSCGSNRVLQLFSTFYDNSTENTDKILAASEVIADACEANPLAKYVDTEQTVRDMDLIRVLLGDDKLNYVGYSYGSWLGAWYAKLFPERAGHMVLDANTDFANSFQDSFGLQPLGFDRAFKDIAAAYIARNSALFDLGSSNDEVYDVFLGLPERIKQGFAFDLGVVNDLYAASEIPQVGFKLMAAAPFEEILGLAGEPLELNNLVAVVSGYSFSPIEQVDGIVREYAFDLAFGYYFGLEPGETRISFTASSAVFRAIQCQDSVWNKDPEFNRQRGIQSSDDYPLLGNFRMLEPCAYWGKPTTSMPAVPANIPPMLLVQTEFDAATPTEGARNAFASLPNAAMVFVENEVSHAAFPYNDSCVDLPVATFLLTGNLPSDRVSNCQAKPLPGEETVFPPGQPVSPLALSTFSLEAALAPTLGNAIYDELHRLIREGAAEAYGHHLLP